MPQVDPKEAHTAALKREVQLLRAENAYLRGQLSGDATTGNPTGLQTGQADGGLARASMMPTSKRPPAEVILLNARLRSCRDVPFSGPTCSFRCLSVEWRPVHHDFRQWSLHLSKRQLPGA